MTETKNGVDGGLRLSYATLGAFTKYPKESLPKKPTNHIADKKYGVFQSEIDSFNEVANELGLLKRGADENMSYSRHPLAYLVEAADDICYTIIDFEDGINLGLIEEEFALEYLINLVKNTINTEKYHNLNQSSDRLAYLRSLAINTLITEAVEVFLKNEEEILKGEFNQALLEKSQYQAQINDIIKISIDKIYQSKEVVEKEIAGYKVLETLIDTYTTSIEHVIHGEERHYDRLILKNFTDTISEKEPLYKAVLAACHYVSRLTDGKSLQLFERVRGDFK